ncbi:hypothetical protein ACTMQQ_28305 [Pseudomonas syringae pv. aptata]|uniref:hypothetical protein n=1 Tax=Pseudomonas syringae TaxID=317 RepID=UPI003F8A5D1A
MIAGRCHFDCRSLQLEIDRIVNDPANDWSDSYSLYSAGREVDHHGFPVNPER